MQTGDDVKQISNGVSQIHPRLKECTASVNTWYDCSHKHISPQARHKVPGGIKSLAWPVSMLSIRMTED